MHGIENSHVSIYTALLGYNWRAQNSSELTHQTLCYGFTAWHSMCLLHAICIDQRVTKCTCCTICTGYDICHLADIYWARLSERDLHCGSVCVYVHTSSMHALSRWRLLPEFSVGDPERRQLKLKHAWRLTCICTPCCYRSSTAGCPQAVQISITTMVEVAPGIKGHA